MKNNLRIAFISGFRHWRIVLLVYLLQLLLAIPLAMQVWHVLEASIGSSLEINKLLPGYDHTVISDFLKVHGGSITPLIGQLRWALVVWALASVFINGGVLATLVKKTPTWLAFWTEGATYFGKFLKIAVVFFVLFLIWTGATLLPFLANLQMNLESMASEKTVLGYAFVLLVGWFIGLIYLNNSAIIAKTAIIEEGMSTFQGIKKGLIFNFRHFFKTAGIFLIFSALQLLSLALYWWLEGKSGMVTAGLVVVFFLVQQGLVLVRVMGRVMVMAGISIFYTTGQTVNPINSPQQT
ncbi:MAG: hypothetical protein K9J37_02885 [Saprospiraceae bacterium]|nr:hypothetical protein [Saprospiraceae bacterium]MCF8248827.1 hypothetical protein [Saprospiraceae bacterium]MCF8279882.1 hypothetical protein [Bacteroidales bacterium]MCF8310112.1 hypothetical protein [Saprospiraceae bacterium]MCF8439012.1 hypothetical protein [Saprospiraceae bacterium]